MPNELILENNSDVTSVQLPVSNKDLGEFITGLLGQQQTFEKTIHTNFDINQAWLIDLHEQLHQSRAKSYSNKN